MGIHTIELRGGYLGAYLGDYPRLDPWPTAEVLWKRAREIKLSR
jgi:hypothetical protein